MAEDSVKPPLFTDIGDVVQSDNPGNNDGSQAIEQIESLCMNCHENGTTRLLLTRIPFFREIVIMSFYCPHCHFSNSEVQPAGAIQSQGHKYNLRVEGVEDLGRQVIRSDTSVLRIEDIDLEIPPGRGQLTTVEGVLQMVQKDLMDTQHNLKQSDPETATKLVDVVLKLNRMANADIFPFSISLDDPAGNSSIEPSPSDARGKYVRHEYNRSPEQNESLGLKADAAPDPSPTVRQEYRATQLYPAEPAQDAQNNVDADEDIVEDQVYTFPTSCPGCMKMCETRMKMVKIPHFKEVVIMSTVCEHCGYKTSEVKTGGDIPDKGRRITLQVKSVKDLSRDLLKSESCTLECPEISLSVEAGTLGGRFTTVEGLIAQVRDDLRSSVFDTDAAGSKSGDSMAAEEQMKWDSFFSSLDGALEVKTPFTLILKDPTASSYIQSFTAPDPDPQITVEEYERTEEEEDDLGLGHMNTENYDTS